MEAYFVAIQMGRSVVVVYDSSSVRSLGLEKKTDRLFTHMRHH